IGVDRGRGSLGAGSLSDPGTRVAGGSRSEASGARSAASVPVPREPRPQTLPTLSSVPRFRTMDSVTDIFGKDLSILDGKVAVRNDAALTSDKMDRLVRSAVFGEKDEREYARWLLWEIGQAVGVQPASIHDLYMARGRREIHG